MLDRAAISARSPRQHDGVARSAPPGLSERHADDETAIPIVALTRPGNAPEKVAIRLSPGPTSTRPFANAYRVVARDRSPLIRANAHRVASIQRRRERTAGRLDQEGELSSAKDRWSGFVALPMVLS